MEQRDTINFAINWLIKTGVFVVALVIFFGSFYVIGVGQVGVIFNQATGQTKSVQSGFNLKMPVIEQLSVFDIRTQRIDIVEDCASKDLQLVRMKTVINYHLDYTKVNEIFTKVGRDYTDKIIIPITNEIAKSLVSQYTVENIIVKRAELKDAIEVALRVKLGEYFIVIESVNLVNVDFTPEFNRIVEAKQIEEQKIKTAEYKKMQAAQNKEAVILEAEGESKRQELIKATVNPQIVSLEWIKKWDGKLPVTMLGDKTVMMVNQDENK
ncbi:MAG: prohibitin family protein [Candidatus Omnitrophica bacterium]|jgi:prohibitin 2|nr:prohibitin family protein [Candidatus Omnitrophota bacterium]MDD5078890.1 prohibitin family protein [Candidatus Omnitrophota bacterium]